MSGVNEELTRTICEALRKVELISEDVASRIANSIASGKIKAEDWYSAIEESLPAPKGDKNDDQGAA